MFSDKQFSTLPQTLQPQLLVFYVNKEWGVAFLNQTCQWWWKPTFTHYEYTPKEQIQPFWFPEECSYVSLAQLY